MQLDPIIQSLEAITRLLKRLGEIPSARLWLSVGDSDIEVQITCTSYKETAKQSFRAFAAALSSHWEKEYQQYPGWTVIATVDGVKVRLRDYPFRQAMTCEQKTHCYIERDGKRIPVEQVPVADLL